MDDAAEDRVLETVLARLALFAASPLPPGLFQPALDLLVANLRRRHPHAFERLAELTEADILVDALDLPLAFRLTVGPRVRLGLCRRDAIEPAAVIRGTFPVLLDLLEGRTDGDALFFSRDLVIEGDTAIVVALRNAVDGEDIDLARDLAGLLGPLGRLLAPARAAASRLNQRMIELQRTLLAPVSRRVETIERRLARLEKKAS